MPTLKPIFLPKADTGNEKLNELIKAMELFTTDVKSTFSVMDEAPCARAYLSADQDNLVNGSWTKILLNTESYDVGSNFDTTNNKFVVPITGYYQVNALIMFEGNDIVADKLYGIQITKNSYPLGLSYTHASKVSGISCPISDTYYLTVNDEIALWAISYSGDSNVDVESGAYYTFLSIRLVQQ